MIPILFKQNEIEFTTNGIGKLSETISCVVEEARNGIYELSLKYPITGKLFNEIELKRIIYARHDDKGDCQPFRIYSISKPINGIITVYASHISYDLSKIVVEPFTAETINEAFIYFPQYAINNCPFTFWTDKTTRANFKVEVPSSLRAMLGGVEGSVLDVFGAGEYEWDNFTVKFHSARGHDSGVTIRYGKNLIDLTHTYDSSSQYSGVAPFWRMEDVIVVLPEGAIYDTSASIVKDFYNDHRKVVYDDGNGHEYDGQLSNPEIIPLDLSDAFDEQPTVEQLRTAATTYLNSLAQKTPKENILISFVQLWQTEEYKNVAALQRVSLCDTVNVIYNKLGVNVSAKVIRVRYNVLLEKYDEMELGEPRATMASTLGKQDAEIQGVKNLVKQSSVTMTDLQIAINTATKMITGANGGYVRIDPDETTGYPKEILIMDTPNKATAVNVWRWNSGGLGHSSSGYNGPYSDAAITADGRINANFITVGTLSAALIKSGTMSADRILGGSFKVGGTNAGAGGNGKIQLYDSGNNQVGEWNINGLTIGSNFFVDMDGTVNMSNAHVQGSINVADGELSGFIIDSNSIRSGMTSFSDTTHDGIWIGSSTSNGGIAFGKGVFKVTSKGVLTATSGTIAKWHLGANNLSAYNDTSDNDGTYTQYNVLLNSPESIGATSNALVIRDRSYTVTHDSSGNKQVSYGDWDTHITFKYSGYAQFTDISRTGQCIVSGAAVNGNVQKEIRISNGRVVAYRHEIVDDSEVGEYWTGVLDQGLATGGGNPTITRWCALMTYPSNKVGLGVTTSASGNIAGELVLWYDGTYNTSGKSTSDMSTRGVIVCNRPLWMQTCEIANAGKITSNSTVQGMDFLQSGGSVTAYCVTGRTRQVNGSDAYYQIGYANSYTFFYLNTGQIASIAPSTSDERKKKNIHAIDDDLLKRIDGVELKQFKFRKDAGFGDYTHYGAIAQDVQKALGDVDSNMVYETPDTDELNLNYTEFLVLKVAALEKRIRELESKMEV